jgi:putative transposase
MPQERLTLEDDVLKEVMLGKHEEAVTKLLEQVFNSVLQAQATEQLNAEPYERSDERTMYRNGSRTRMLATWVGSLVLHVPKFRDGTLRADLFTSYQRSEQALLLSLMEMVIQGVSTRKISEITETLCGSSFSKSTVSALCEQLDPVVDASSESSALTALSIPGGRCHLYESPGTTPDSLQRLPDCHRGERRRDTGGARFHRS